MKTDIDNIQTFKILLVGDSGVGKTSLMIRLVHGHFRTNHAATIGLDFQIATFPIGNYCCRLQIWDTAGQERFRSMTNNYYRGADGIIIVYDITNRESYNNVNDRLCEITCYCDKNIPKILVGNKADDSSEVKRVILENDARKYAIDNELLFFETSVKDNKNIIYVFNEIAKYVLQQRLKIMQNTSNVLSSETKISAFNKDQSKCC